MKSSSLSFTSSPPHITGNVCELEHGPHSELDGAMVRASGSPPTDFTQVMASFTAALVSSSKKFELARKFSHVAMRKRSS
jgi:hypothetical protein